MIEEMTTSTVQADETAHETAPETDDVHDPPGQIAEIEAGNIGTGERALVTVIVAVEMDLLTLSEGQSQMPPRTPRLPPVLKRYALPSIIALHRF